LGDKIGSIKNKTLKYLGIALIAIGIVISAYPLYTNFVMKRIEVDVMNSWENQISSDTTMQATTTETSGGQTAQSQQVIPEALFKITIPKINSSWVGYEGTNIPSLKRGPGHYIGTPMPGELGTCVIAGHRTTYGAPFNRLDQLVNGDQIILETVERKQFTYLVTGKMEVLPNDLSAFKQTEYASLILTTSTPKFYATRMLLVFAKLAQ
jgi:sortase A